MENLKKYKNVLLLAVLLILGFFAYQKFFVKPSLPEGTTIVSDTVNNEESDILLATLKSIESIKLDRSILSNQKFTSLIDNTIILNKPVAPELGRGNPFAPIGNESILPRKISQSADTELQNIENTNVKPQKPTRSGTLFDLNR